jgi:hypothetical protein
LTSHSSALTTGFIRDPQTPGLHVAAFELADGYLTIVREAGSVTDGATTHTVALTDITGLPDVGVGQDHDGSRTITCRIDADRSVDAVLPVAFLTQVAQASEQVAPPPDHFGAAGSAQPPKAAASVDEDVHPTPAETTPPSLTASTRRGPTRWQVAGRVGNSLLVFILLGSLVYVRKTSNDQTDRANQAEATLAATDAELTQTKESLDERTNDLSDSNEENADLTARVSELSNEKAEVQDERNAAREVSSLATQAAGKMLECRDRILDAMQYSAAQLYDSTISALDDAAPICQEANTLVSDLVDSVEG